MVEVEIKVLYDKISDGEFIQSLLDQKTKHMHGIQNISLKKKSLDARGRFPMYVLRYVVYEKGDVIPDAWKPKYKNTKSGLSAIIIGAGPAGYFAALRLLEAGIRPIVLERGKDVRSRRRDLKNIMQNDVVNPDSNYCFGEGGAGTYSDGKLYTRSLKRGSGADVLETLVYHGAPDDIRTDAHPHIGSNVLPKIIENIRNTILNFGGEIHFDHKVTDLIIENQKVKGVKCNDLKFMCDHVILATGHSARDVFYMLDVKGIKIEPKPFALGLRIEHLQSTIDVAQYKIQTRHEDLPPSAYSLVTQVEGKGVFSFCMCPGGLIVPAATSPGEIVVNGMSLSRRDSQFANSGFVTSIELDELSEHGFNGTFACLNFQESIEKAMSEYVKGTQKAPAQRVKDFVDGVLSKELNPTSYIPGLVSAPLHTLLPEFIYKRLRQGLVQIDKQQIKGFITNDANIVAIESRTSSPIRIPRDAATLEHTEVNGLYPCGEGAGYAGGIVSAAIDGQNVANAIIKKLGLEV
ncbi:MAG: FAD-dependent oxidoreductase [Lewinellaceae bacterium]|nr:FAD-dependent oxidoreductase [Lewinellaceae bacterium]